jgi:hypothetical protein
MQQVTCTFETPVVCIAPFLPRSIYKIKWTGL